MTGTRNRHGLVLVVVLLTASFGAVAPAVASPTDTVTVGETLDGGSNATDGGDSPETDATTDIGSTDDSSTDDSSTDDDSPSTDGDSPSTADGDSPSTDDDSSTADGDSTSTDSDAPSTDDDSPSTETNASSTDESQVAGGSSNSSSDAQNASVSDSPDDGWESQNVTHGTVPKHVDRVTPIAVDEPFLFPAPILAEVLRQSNSLISLAGPTDLSRNTAELPGLDGTSVQVDSVVGSVDVVTDGTDDLLDDPSIVGVIGPIDDGTVAAVESGSTPETNGSEVGVAAPDSSLFTTNGFGDFDGDSEIPPAGPTAGLALGLGAIAAAAVTRQSSLMPGLVTDLADLGLAMTAGAVPVRVRSTLGRLVRTLVPLRYSRYDDSDPLEHETRADVFQVVEESPGAYLSELSDRAGIPLSTARHHVRVLEREDIVSGAKVRGKRRFYPIYTTDVELSAAMNDEATAALLDALARLGSVSVSELADEVGRDPSTVTHHLQRLEEDAIVVRERDGRSVVNKLSPEARTALEPDASDASTASDAEVPERGEALASD